MKDLLGVTYKNGTCDVASKWMYGYDDKLFPTYLTNLCGAEKIFENIIIKRPTTQPKPDFATVTTSLESISRKEDSKNSTGLITSRPTSSSGSPVAATLSDKLQSLLCYCTSSPSEGPESQYPTPIITPRQTEGEQKLSGLTFCFIPQKCS